MRCLTSLILASLAGVAIAAGEPSQTSAQLAAIGAHLKQVGAKGEIPSNHVHTRVVAGPREGQIAIAVLYTHESPNGEGNDYIQRLAVFLKAGSSLSAPIDVVAGGAIRRAVSLRAVNGDRVVLDSLSYAPQDFVCCPSIPGVVTYRLSEHALVEAGSPN